MTSSKIKRKTLTDLFGNMFILVYIIIIKPFINFKKSLSTNNVILHVILCVCVAETPIEEFTPTPAFPALQYLESVDVEGVAWRAGLRTGDFLIEV